MFRGVSKTFAMFHCFHASTKSHLERHDFTANLSKTKCVELILTDWARTNIEISSNENNRLSTTIDVTQIANQPNRKKCFLKILQAQVSCNQTDCIFQLRL